MSLSFTFDFGRIKLKDRHQFAADMQRAFNPPDGLSTQAADHLLIRWMAQTVVAWPNDGYHWDDPAHYADISITAFMEGVRAFGAQFRTAFNPLPSDRTANREVDLRRAHRQRARRPDRHRIRRP